LKTTCLLVLASATLLACTGSGTSPSPGTTGTSGAGGSAGGASGGAGTSGTGGAVGTGTGGATGTGGGTGSGGAGSGGSPGTGGSAGTGGSTGAGGTPATGGSTGTGGSSLTASYYIGADITNQETQPDATRANLLTLMKAHGFNYVRLRTFVDPKAADGYDKTNGFDDIAHTVAFGKQVKDAGMGLLVDFHYSDNWADPGKQCVPTAWQSLTTITDLATAVHDYTKDAITKLIAGGARPDMVQIGNESTPGILIHLCDAGGLPRAGIAGYNALNGALYLYSSTDRGAPPAGGPAPGGWNNLGMLLNAGVQGVKDVDTGIKIALHLDRGNDLASSRNYIQNAMAKAVPFDVFGESCYTVTQGQPADWLATFTALAAAFPNLKFMIAEYSGAQRAANDVIFNLLMQQGIGTFNWQPSTLWTRAGANYTVGTDMAIYDQMKTDYASRL
jgi:arabinogalactan endo-1,4-beta-galactosidase